MPDRPEHTLPILDLVSISVKKDRESAPYRSGFHALPWHRVPSPELETACSGHHTDASYGMQNNLEVRTDRAVNKAGRLYAVVPHCHALRRRVIDIIANPGEHHA